MKIDSEKRINYGAGWIREHPDWLKKHPTGPVHWDVWDSFKKPIGEEIPAHELQNFMVNKGLLILW